VHSQAEMLAQYSRQSLPITANQPQRLGGDRTPPKAENSGLWTDGLIQDCCRLPISIEFDCLIRGIIDHKTDRFAKRGDRCGKAIERLTHEIHRPLSSVKIDAKEFLDTDDRGHENRGSARCAL